MPNNEKQNPVVYVPFRTFLSAIEGLEHGIPHQIDTSMWPTYSGAIKSQLIGSFKFLNLIDEAGTPTPWLKALVDDKANRKTHLRKTLESSYSKVVSVGLQQMTPKQFDDLMSEYGMEGSTHQKVVSFFLQAAKFSGLPMSPLLGKKTRVSGRRRKTGEESGNGTSNTVALSTEPGTLPRSTSRTVTLKSGGKLSLSLEANLFDLNSSDREFVFGIIDKLQEYEKSKETG